MPKPNELGDAPVELEYRAMMNEVARVLDSFFNGDAGMDERKTGFILLVFPFNTSDGRCNYISNGANRKDVVAMMKEQIKRFEEDEKKDIH